MEATDIAYMAGLFDGEGSIDYTKRFDTKRKNRPRSYLCWRITCEIGMTDYHVLKWFHETLDLGTFRPRKSDTKNFPRFARKHGIISKKGSEVSPNGVVASIYKKPSQKKILEILEKLRNTNNSLMGRKIVKEKKKLVITVFDKLKNKDDRPKNEKIYRQDIADEVTKQLSVKTDRQFVRNVLREKRSAKLEKKLNKPI